MERKSNYSHWKQVFKTEIGVYPSFFYYRQKLCILWLKGSERLPIFSFMFSLRMYEYYINNDKNLINIIFKQFWRFIFRKNQLKHYLFIEPNTIEPGCIIMHPGYRKIPQFAQIGENATILPMVLIGGKNRN